MYVTLPSYVPEKQGKDKTRLPRVYWAVVVIFYTPAECVRTYSYTRENKQRQRQMHLKITLVILARVRLLYSGLIEG